MMLKLLEFKDFLKRICDGYWICVKIVIKFLSAFAVLWLMSGNMGYSSVMANTLVITVVSAVVAFAPDVFFPLAVITASLVQVYAVSVAMAAVMFVVYLIVYFLYVRFAPGQVYVIIAVPILYTVNIPYFIPLLCGIFFGPYAAVSNIIGIFIYYAYKAIENVAGLSGDTSIMNTINFFNIVVDNVKSNRYMLFSMIIFSFAACTTYLIRRQKFKYASYAGIVTGVIELLVAFVLASSLIENADNFVNVIIGVAASGIMAAIMQFFRMSLDYSGTKNIQFEDDEYYYYVRAVPKLNVSAPDKQVKTIHAQVPTGNTFNLKDTIEKVLEDSEKE